MIKTSSKKISSQGIKEFLSHNSQVNLGGVNFLNAQTVKKLQWPNKFSETEKAELLETLKILQRLVRLTKDQDLAIEMHNQLGVFSAVQIASMPKGKFVEDCAGLCAGYDSRCSFEQARDKAETIYQHALAIKSKAVLTYTAIAQQTSAHYRNLRANNLSALTDTLGGTLPSYQDLFGSTDFCTCPDCRSILSPAAYFVDLMRLEAKYIKKNPDISSLFDLQYRRPGLWTLQLSCDNTNTLIPTLQIAVESMETLMAKTEPVTTYETLATTANYPFNLPFHLPLTRLRNYLGNQQISLPDLWRQLLPSPNPYAVSRETLQLSKEQWDFYSTMLNGPSNDNLRALNKYYGSPVTIDQPSENELIEALTPVTTFLDKAGFIQKQLNLLLFQDLTDDQISDGWRIAEHRILEPLGSERPKTIFYEFSPDNEHCHLIGYVSLNSGELGSFEIKYFQPNGKQLAYYYQFLSEWELLSSTQTEQMDLIVKLISLIDSNKSVIIELILSIAISLTTKYKSDLEKSFILAQKNFFINVGSESASAYVPPLDMISFKDDKGKVQKKIQNLTFMRLDRIHRFIRLANILNWTFAELDWALRTVCVNLNDINTGLSGLAWIKSLSQERELSVTECCALIGEMKNYGGANGTPLFQQVFKNAFKLNNLFWPPDNLSWTVPTAPVLNVIGDNTEDDQAKIQSALAGALKLTQDDLIFIGNLIVTNHPNSKRQIALSLTNLSILYRLSRIPAIFSFSVKEFTVLLSLRGVGTTNSIAYLTSSDPAEVIPTLAILDEFSKKLIQMDWNVYRIEYWLQGDINQPVKSGDRTIQNQLLSINEIDNFSEELKQALTQILLNKLNFHQVMNSLLSQVRSTDLKISNISAEDQIFSLLQTESYIDKTYGIIYQVVPDDQSVFVALLNPLFNIPTTPIEKKNRIEDLIDSLANLLQSTLDNYFKIQQHNLGYKLAGLLGIMPACVVPILHQTVLKQNVGIILLDQVFKRRVHFSSTDDFVKTLHHLQRYLDCLVNAIKLSPNEIDYLQNHPEYFFKNNRNSSHFVFKEWSDIENLARFKQLVQIFKDENNALLSYFDDYHTEPSDDTRFNQLAVLSQWNKDQIRGIASLFDPAKNWGTVEGVFLLNQCFTQVQQLGIDIGNLKTFFDICTPASINYQTYEVLANIVWNGLSKTDSLNKLNTIENFINQIKRTILISWSIDYLRNITEANNTKPLQNIVTNSRALYEYLLIDVEVSGVVQTSRIKEAISAIQLYIYRAFNQLEAATIDSEFKQWWLWMRSYRVWEANRKVFLYPENYLKPELLNIKSEQFQQLENELMQSNLDPAQINTVFNSYLDGFRKMLNLKVMDFYVLPETNDGEVGLYLTARTAENPNEFYYRFALFQYDDETRDSYMPLQWDPWSRIDLSISSEYLSPVYAFNKLFIFWVEINNGQTDRTDSSHPMTTYEAAVKYSYGNFNKGWIAPQTIYTEKNIKGVNEYYSKVKLFYQNDATTNAVSCIFAGKELKITENGKVKVQQLSWRASSVDPGRNIKVFAHSLSGDARVQTVMGSPDVITHALFFSYDGGGKWINKISVSIPEVIKPLTISLDGRIQTYIGTNVFISRDSGHNWQQSSLSAKISAVAMSTDGKIQTAVAMSTDVTKPSIYISSDYGESWSEKYLLGKLTSVAMSADGSIQTAANIDTGQLYVSKDYGNIWTFKIKVPGCCSIAMSADGQVQVAISADLNAYIVISTDGGDNWTILPPPPPLPPQPWLSVTVSADGKTLVALSKANYNSQICISQDTGKTWQWINAGATVGLNAISMSADGNLIVAVSNDGKLYTFPSVFPILKWSLLYKDDTCFLAISGKKSPWQETYIPINAPMVAVNLSNILLLEGINKLLSIDTQVNLKQPDYLSSTLNPVDFLTDVNSYYYWELFFYVPYLIASQLHTQQQSEAAKSWYEYIFDPTHNPNTQNSKPSDNDKYWMFMGLQSSHNPTLLNELSKTWAENLEDDVKPNSLQLKAYHDDPFDPHAIARLRPIAYQKAIVMNYIDNLMQWGDQLFRRYTMEDIIEATMCYVMAYDLLGNRPNNTGECSLPDVNNIQGFLNYYTDVKNIPEFLIILEQIQSGKNIRLLADIPHNYIPNSYFGLPENEVFLSYWQLVEQRLYNIRHGLNIDGVFQALALFEPALNPLQLIKQMNWGDGVDNVLPPLYEDYPYYRFNVMIEKAKNTAQAVIQLGQSLLSALEKQDAETLSQLYNSQQQSILALTQAIRNDELEQMNQSLESLQMSLQSATYRLDYYTNLIADGWSVAETAQISLENTAIIVMGACKVARLAAIPGFLTPNIYGLADGGMLFGQAIDQGANITEGLANIQSMKAGLSGIIAGYQRRDQDWDLQKNLAQKDVDQIKAQILAAQAQQRIAMQNITILNKQIKQSEEIDLFYKTKFTRKQLYQWMKGQLASLYFQAYQLAYEQATQAQKSWEFEHGINFNTVVGSFIRPNYWDNLYDGLLAGESLLLNLQQMENVYMKQNERTLEITKIIPLSQLNPNALENLKSAGKCSFNLGEKDFDYDYMGHYQRQIKTISLTFPALLGPYQTINAMLTQTTNKTLLKPDKAGLDYMLGKQGSSATENVRIDVRANQQVALSQGINDAGLFTMNFNDERYLPFEGTGAVSSWDLSIPPETNGIDLKKITDVIVQLQYTAVNGGDAFVEDVKSALENFSGYIAFSMKQEFFNEWINFINEDKVGNTASLNLILNQNMLRRNLNSYMVTGVGIALVCTNTASDAEGSIEMQLNNYTKNYTFDLKASKIIIVPPPENLGILFSNNICELIITKKRGPILKENIADMFLWVEYTGNFASSNFQRKKAAPRKIFKTNSEKLHV